MVMRIVSLKSLECFKKNKKLMYLCIFKNKLMYLRIFKSLLSLLSLLSCSQCHNFFFNIIDICVTSENC